MLWEKDLCLSSWLPFELIPVNSVRLITCILRMWTFRVVVIGRKREQKKRDTCDAGPPSGYFWQVKSKYSSNKLKMVGTEAYHVVHRGNIGFSRGQANSRVRNFDSHDRFPEGLDVVVDVDEEQLDELVV